MAMDKITAFSRIPSLSQLPRPLIDKLLAVSGIQRIGKGSVLFREGEHAHFVYALVEGSVSLVTGPGREEPIADFMNAGEIVLIPPALLGLPYMVAATAVTDLLVILIPADEFRNMAMTELAFSFATNLMLAGHWRLLLRHLTQTKTRDADTRLIQYLLDSAGATAGAARFSLPGSKKDLAKHLGIAPGTLSRSLKRLAGLGVKTAGSDMQIEDVARLKPLLHQSRRAVTHSAVRVKKIAT